MYSVSLQTIVEKMGLLNCTPMVDNSRIEITHADVNRPALQLAGFFDHFDNERVQAIGNVEYAYLCSQEEEVQKEILTKLLDYKIPCLVFCRGLKPPVWLPQIATERGIPVLVTTKSTSGFMAELIGWLRAELAPRITIHGVLVDVYGEGVLIMGESGIGKSEAALELIKRGHRLVADDAVEIKKVSDDTLVGQAPEISKYLIELRGIGIIDVKTLFGVESVKDSQTIDVVVKLEEWSNKEEYDRMGLEEQYTEFLGNKVVCHTIPIRPGRNLAVIVESAAVNYRTKCMGYNAAEEFCKRVNDKLLFERERDNKG